MNYFENIEISILLPVYNNEDDILRSVDSVLKQTLNSTKWELIIIDDCSTDNSYKYIIDYIQKEEHKKFNISILRNEINKGTFVSLNEGLLIAKGKYICRIDSDDEFANTLLEKQLNVLDGNENYIASICVGYRETKKLHGEITLFYRKKIIEEIGFYDSVRFAADSEFKNRIMKVYGGDKIYRLNEILYFAKKRENSLTTSELTGLIGAKNIRRQYVKNYRRWHNTHNRKHLYMEYPLIKRKFPVHKLMI